MRLQGIGWVTRSAIYYATVTLYIKHYKDAENCEHIDIDQTLTGGIPGTAENRTLNWTDIENEDYLFGNVLSKSRRVKVDELIADGEEFLGTGWTKDTLDVGVIHTVAESNTVKSGTSWIANQVCALRL